MQLRVMLLKYCSIRIYNFRPLMFVDRFLRSDFHRILTCTIDKIYSIDKLSSKTFVHIQQFKSSNIIELYELDKDQSINLFYNKDC